jgi:hypothetical protein
MVKTSTHCQECGSHYQANRRDNQALAYLLFQHCRQGGCDRCNGGK